MHHVEDDPTLLPVENLLRRGDMVDHFKVMRLIGRGGMGEVYLARDTRLGRKVALKVIQPSHLGSKEALGRFLLEAQATARFNHPHIVTIYAVGEHYGVPYVALEYLEGQTLRQRMREESLSVTEALRVGLAVAEALKEAHRNKVLHRDLKPENVLLPPDGRLRVVDFGLAKMAAAQDVSHVEVSGVSELSPATATTADEPTDLANFRTVAMHDTIPGGIRGTPPYMAPEQWRDEECSGAADVWALGIILHELVAGRLPYVERTITALCSRIIDPEPVPSIGLLLDVPGDVSDLIGRALEKDPRRRPTAGEMAEALRQIVFRGRGQLPEEDSPFRGLLPFDERHASFFFGREPEVAAFVERVRHDPLLAVVGPSGAGKSSFVQAGVIPRLRQQGPWVVLSLRPGNQPFRALASQLLFADSLERRGRVIDDLPTARLAASPPTTDVPGVSPREEWISSIGDVAQRMLESPPLLAMLLRKLAAGQGARVLLLIDQLEELYTLVADVDVRRRFMQAVCAAADDAQDPVRVIFTLREDFLGRLAESVEAREALSRVTVIGSPGPEVLEQILRRPLEVVSYAYDDPELVPEMVAVVRGEPACLPLLQFATRMLWEQRDTTRRLLCRAAYDTMGGVAGALARHADGVLEGMSSAQVRLAREILLRLVTPERTRRVLSRGEVVEGLAPEATEVLGRLTQARLVSARKSRGDDEDGDGETELELVHESLVRTWGRLARWIDESHEELGFLAEVSQAAELWDRRGRRDDEVWLGVALHDALRTLQRCSTPVPERARRFLDAGRRRDRRQHRRLRLLLVVGVSLLAVVAAISYQQKERAEHQRHEARRRWAEAQREGARAAQLRGDLLEARAKLRGSLEMEDSPLGRALWWRLSHDPVVWRKSTGAVIYQAAFSPDGKTVAAASQDMSVYLFDATTMAVQRILRGHEDQVLSLAFSADGRRLATGSWSGQVRLWDPRSGAVETTLQVGSGNILGVTFSPDGARLAFATGDNLVRLWDRTAPAGTRPRLLAGHTAQATCVAFSPDGRQLASGGKDRSIRIWDVTSGASTRTLLGHGDRLTSVAFSPDGRRLASASADRTIRVWELSSPQPSRELPGHKDRVYGLAFSPDGKLIASASSDRTVGVWDLASGRPRFLRGHTAVVFSVRFSPDGRFLASASADKTVHVWDLSAADGPVEQAAGHTAGVSGVSFSPDGMLLASGGLDKTVRLWDVTSGAQRRVLVGHTDRIYGVRFSPDGKLLASASEDKTIRLWDVISSNEPRVLAGHASGVHAVSFSADGKLLASASFDATIRLWDLAAGSEVRALRGHVAAVYSLALSPDGRYLASGGFDRAIRVWDLRRDDEPWVLRGHGGIVTGVGFSRAGQLASASHDGSIRLWDLRSGTSRLLGQQGGRIYWLAFHPDGGRLITSSSDGLARIWKLTGGAPLELRGHQAEVNVVAFAPTGALAASTSDDGTVRVWHADTGLPHWRAPALLGGRDGVPRLYSHRGWADLGRGSTAATVHGARERWRMALEHGARSASAADDRGVLCLRTARGLELWDVSTDALLRYEPLPDLRQVVALPAGCVVLASGSARLYPRSGGVKDLAAGTTAAAWDEGLLLLAAGKSVHVLDGDGNVQRQYAVEPGATSLVRSGPWLVLGFADGTIELVPTVPGQAKRALVFEEVPSSAVVRMLRGPMGTLIAGFANGLLGIWSLENGTLLSQVHLHGPVVHLRHRQAVLYAATELGDHHVIDLGAFYMKYCPLLRRVWGSVPVVWEGGGAVRRPPPQNHPCASPQ